MTLKTVLAHFPNEETRLWSIPDPVIEQIYIDYGEYEYNCNLAFQWRIVELSFDKKEIWVERVGD